jgi:uncharacterized protein (TIGR00730 family)
MVDIKDEKVVKLIKGIIDYCGGAEDPFAIDLTTQMIQTCLKLMAEGHDIWQMKLINKALKEMRHAYSIFGKYTDVRCVSIFGSARTPEDHPDYRAAKTFSRSMAKEGWMCITGAAEGIMHAGMKGAQKESSIGLSIRLPFEDSSNALIKGDPKLMMFHYFFTRKLMFISHGAAIAAFPGGLGTQDELFEVLTLMQTGKSNIVPLVLIEGAKGNYWKHWERYLDDDLLANGWISQADKHFYHIASSPADAKRHILKFYSRYHSSRYVKELLVIRLLKELNQKQIKELNKDFSKLLVKGKIIKSKALPEETDSLKLPRLVFEHNRKHYGLLRAMIDRINDY